MTENCYKKQIRQKQDYVGFAKWYFENIETEDTLQNLVDYVIENELVTGWMTRTETTAVGLSHTLGWRSPKNTFKHATFWVDGKPTILWTLFPNRTGRWSKTPKKHPKWSEEEIRFVTENYMSMTDRELSKHIHRKPGTICQERSLLGLKKSDKIYGWTKKDLDYLTVNYLFMTDREIGDELNKSKGAVGKMRIKLGLSKYTSMGNGLKGHLKTEVVGCAK